MVKKAVTGCHFLSRGDRAPVMNSRNGVVRKNKTKKTSYKSLKLVGKYGNLFRALDRCVKAKHAALRTLISCKERDEVCVEKDEDVDEEEEENDYSILMREDGELKAMDKSLMEKTAKKPENQEEQRKECFTPLTRKEEREIICAFKDSNRKKVFATHENSRTKITGKMLQCLMPGRWLDDGVINMYLHLLKERETREPQKFLKCHFFNSFFYKVITRGCCYHYEKVRRWTKQDKNLGYTLLECDKIFVPIHQENHWCLAIINKKEKKFQYLDSLKGVDSQVLDTLARYYVDEVQDKYGIDIDISSWEREFVSDLPEQKNGFDCGMFMIKYADFHSRDIGLCFSQEHMPYFRKRTARDILSLKDDMDSLAPSQAQDEHTLKGERRRPPFWGADFFF